MFDNQSLWSRISIIVINIFVIIFSLLIVITYTIHKRLQGNPGRFVQIIFILQTVIYMNNKIMSIQTVLSEFYGTTQNRSNFIISRRLCECLGSIQIFTAVANTLLNCSMILNLWMQIKYKSYDFKKIQHMSFIFSFGMGLFIPLVAYQNNDIYISVLGNCALSYESDVDTYVSVLSIALLVFNFVIIWLIVRRRDQIQIHTEIYHTKVQRFQRKYQDQYISTNVIYSIIFLLTRLVPEVLLINKSVCDDSRKCREFFTISLCLGNLILAAIRITEPIFRKQVKRQFTRQKEDNLNQRLLQPETSQVINQQESIKKIQIQQPSEDIDKVEFHVFPIQQSESIDTLEPPQLIKLISSLNQNQRQVQTNTDTILETNNHFPLIICAANYALDDVPLIYDTKTYPFQFNQMQSRRFQVAISDDCYSNRPTIPSVSEIKDQKSFIDPSYDVQVITYGKVVLATKLKQMFEINLKTVRESLNWYHNMRKFDEVPTKGTSFISSNGLVSIEFVTTLQKKLMTRGGGLMMSWKKWEEEAQSHKGIFLPVIISLQTFIIEDQVYNIVIKLNRIFLDYPVVDHQWENNYILNEFIKNNIMGWMTIKNGVLTKRFLAQKIRDGIKNWNFTKNDYLLDKGEKLRLLDQIKQDQSMLQMMGCSYSLQIVFYKHKTNQLNLILSKEKQGFGQSYDQFEPKTPDINVVGGLEHYDINTKLGFVKVFWDDSFKQPINEDEFIKLLQTIQENF